MKLGKAAGLDGLTAEHLHYCNSILPCVLCLSATLKFIDYNVAMTFILIIIIIIIIIETVQLYDGYRPCTY